MVVTVNAVMAMPFALRAIRPAYDAASERHERLSAQLGISGWARLLLIDWPSLRRPLATAFAFAMALSLGDLGVIALFGSDPCRPCPICCLHAWAATAPRTPPAWRCCLAWSAWHWYLRRTGWEGKRSAMSDGTKDRKGVPVRLDKVSFSYGEAPLTFDVAFAAAEITAVMGPSGSGKSTLLNLVAGFETPQSGRVLIGGANVGAAPPAARPVSMVFQENNLFAHLSVEQNVGLGRSPSLRLTEADRADITGALARTGLAGKEALPRELSGGERQRVALARVLVRDRPVLLLDEPFASLGPALRDDMLDLVAGLHAERGMTVLFVTHQPEDARRIGRTWCFWTMVASRPRHRGRFFLRGWSGGVPALCWHKHPHGWITRYCPEADIIYAQTGSWRYGVACHDGVVWLGPLNTGPAQAVICLQCFRHPP